MLGADSLTAPRWPARNDWRTPWRPATSRLCRQWETNFEALAIGLEGTAAVPEPTTLVLVLLALAAAPLRVRYELSLIHISAPTRQAEM